MSNRLTVSLVVIVFLSLIGYGVYNFYQTHEYKEITKHTGVRGEARKNPLYAARLFLKRMGIQTETKNSIQGLNGLPNNDTVLLISSNRSTLSNKRTLELIDWVKSGGHIIAKTTKDWKYSGSEKIDDIKKSKKHSPDPLQRYMGVRTGSRNYVDDSSDEIKTIEKIVDEIIDSNAIEKENTDNIHKIILNGVDKQLALYITRFRTILLDSSFNDITEKVQLDGNTFMVRQKVGSGLITLVSDMSFIENDDIEYADHAEILWHLIHGLHTSITQPKAVWLIHNDEMPSLWDILWDKAWTFILSLLLLLGAWLLLSTHRFGPMIPKQQENRRSLNEHISSSGNFYWKNNKKTTLINSSRSALLIRLSRLHPGWEQRTIQEKVALIAEQTSMKPETLHQLIFSDINKLNFEQADMFTQLIKDLESIRTKR